jgi:hypothetical protein
VKHSSAAGRGLEIDLALKPFDDLLDNAQAQTRAALETRVGSVDLGEPLENAILECVGDARTVVANGNADRGVAIFDNDDLSTPERSCIGSPERKYINDSGKKAPDWGPYS